MSRVGLTPQGARVRHIGTPGSGLHPEVATMVRESAAPPARSDVRSATDLRRRKRERMATLDSGPEMAEVRDVDLKGADRDVAARVYVPREAPVGVVVYYHGGGWVTGTLDDYDPVCTSLAEACGAVIVSVDYRLAPEHPFPEPLEDALLAAQAVAGMWARAHPLVLAGDSAGGNLAAVCAQELSASGAASIALQALICPVLDHDLNTASYRKYGSGYLLDRADMEWYWEQHVPSPDLRGDPRASPLRAADLSGAPPALLVLAGCDPLRDEGLAYATRLAEAGVSTRVVVLDDVVHGFFPMATRLQRAREAILAIGDAVRDACRGFAAPNPPLGDRS